MFGSAARWANSCPILQALMIIILPDTACGAHLQNGHQFPNSLEKNSRNLIEWKAINLSDSKLESSMKTTFRVRMARSSM